MQILCLCVLHYMYYRCMHVKTEENVHDLEWSKEIQKQKNCIKLDDVGLSYNRGRENAERKGRKAEGRREEKKCWVKIRIKNKGGNRGVGQFSKTAQQLWCMRLAGGSR